MTVLYPNLCYNEMCYKGTVQGMISEHCKTVEITHVLAIIQLCFS